MEILEGKSGAKLINDCYNASYDSMKAALEHLKITNANKKIAILGDIQEAGDFSKDIHEKVGEEVYKNNVDVLVTVGDNAKYIAEMAEKLGMDKNSIFVCNCNDEAIKKAEEIICKGDCVLIKASNGMNFKEIMGELV